MKRSSTTSTVVLRALGAFAICCGAILLIAGEQSPEDDDLTFDDELFEEPACDPEAVSVPARRALSEVRSADYALQSENYGRAETHMKSARSELIVLMNATDAGVESTAP